MPADSSRPDRDDTAVVGDRIIAQVLDIVVMTVQLLAVSLLAIAVLGVPGAGAFFLGVLTLPLYGGLLEGYWDGQTLGKRVVGVRVVDARGGDCTPTQAFVRNLPALLIPGWFVYLVALASMAMTDRRQRVFDRLADTVVVGTQGIQRAY